MRFIAQSLIFSSLLGIVGCQASVWVLGEGDAGPAGSDGGVAPGTTTGTGGGSPGADSGAAPAADPELLTAADENVPIIVPGGGLGFWQTDFDRGGSRVQPFTSVERAFTFSKGGGYRGNAARIEYSIAPIPMYEALGTEVWSARDLAGQIDQPHGAVGFEFRERSAPYSVPTDKLGIKFWAKGEGASIRNVTIVEFPTTDTDVATFEDDFITTCTCDPMYLPAGEDACEPINGAKRSKDPSGMRYTCGTHFHYGIRATDSWREYAILFKDLRWADTNPETGAEIDYPFVDRSKLTNKVVGTDDPVGWDRSQLTKVWFNGVIPGYGEPTALGALWIDEVSWVTASDGIQQSGPVGAP